jgi:hypothetical protein
MNAVSAVEKSAIENTSALEKRPTQLRRSDVSALKLISGVFNDSIRVNGDYVHALDQMVSLNRREVIALQNLDAFKLKTHSAPFICQESARKRSVNLIHSILIEHVHPGLDENDQDLALAIIEKMVIPTSSWAR